MSKIFLLGGGTSLASLDFSKIEKYPTMGINKSFKFYNTTYLYWMDVSFYKYIINDINKLPEDATIEQQFYNFKGVKYTTEACGKYRKLDGINYIKPIKTQMISLDLEQGLFFGSNSGFGAMMLAVALGYKEIYLLGYDMKVVNNKTHYHEGYVNQSVSALDRRLGRFLTNFNTFAPKLKKLDINIVNLNPQSALKCFPFKTLDEVI